MRTLLASLAVLVFSGIVASCSSTPEPASSRTATDTDSGQPAASPTATPYVAQPGDDRTPDDVVPDFTGAKFNSYPMHNIRPRIVEISIETTRIAGERAANRPQIENAVRGAIETALKRSNITVVSRSQNKINFTIKDCRNLPDNGECIALDAVFRSPKFELEVGGYSQGDPNRAYFGAINAVMERLNKQLEIVGAHQ